CSYDYFQGDGGEKLRLLDNFSMYFEDGRPAPPNAVDSIEDGGVVVMFGTILGPSRSRPSATRRITAPVRVRIKKVLDW
ncbi:unnamed protein product, partial [Ascophyllum nodosum]